MARFRYHIVGTLTTTAPLCIRSGETWKDRMARLPRSQRGQSFRPCNANFPKDVDVALIVRDHRGMPYIPASGLKGAISPYLRRLVAADRSVGRLEHCAGVSKEARTDVIANLFGEEPRREKPLRGVRRGENSSTPASEKALGVDAAGGRGGCILFEDAFVLESWLARYRRGNAIAPLGGPWWSERELTFVDTSVSIARRTRTAAEAMLLYTEAVPAGVTFRLALTVDHENEGFARLMLLALKGFGLRPCMVPIQLGSETSSGWGRLEWSLDRPEASVTRLWPGGSLPSLELLAFGRGPESDPWPAPRLLHGGAKRHGKESDGTSDEESSLIHLTARIELRFDGPFLVNDPSQCKAQPDGDAMTDDEDANEAEDSAGQAGAVERSPDHYPHLTVDGRPLLPASSFRGPFRSQIERIVRTLSPEAPVGPHHRPGCKRPDEQQCDSIEHLPTESPLRKLLGTTGAGSVLWCSDFREAQAATRNDQTIKRQEMVGIDRFTGAAAEHLKYDVAYIEGCLLEGEIRVDLDGDTDSLALSGLIALALWDLCDGDITFGYGAAKGFGECRASIKRLSILGMGAHSSAAWKDLLNANRSTTKSAAASDDEINAAWAAALSGQGPREDWDPVIDKLLTHLRDNQRLVRWTKREPAESKAVPLSMRGSQ
jgi:CRISPR/Cas system CSM-associated protein Csm3 (group 7 of RAMP superfamily)